MDGNEMNELRELVDFLKENGIAEFDLERAETKIRIKFAGSQGAGGIDLSQIGQLLASQAATAASAGHAAAPAVQVSAEEDAHVVKSPIVGTFYDSPSPGSSTFVKVGDVVEVGQVLCIVEAMKLMNEIESDVAGEVVRQIAKSSQPVEFGQPLFAIKPM